MRVEEFIDIKSRLIMELELAKRQFWPPEQLRSLANEIADYESKIAEKFLGDAQYEKAVVNLISQASCLVDAGRIADSINVYKKALDFSKRESLRRWIKQEIKNVQRKYENNPRAVISMNEYKYVERPFLDQLSALGWRTIDQGIGIPSNPVKSCRTNFRQVALKDIFKQSVKTINKLSNGQEWLTDEQLEKLYEELTDQPTKNLLEANQDILKLFYKAIVDRNEVTGEECPEIKIIDFQNPYNNNFLAINQFRIDTPGRVKNFICPDIVLFVNGLPLVVVECKDTNINVANPLYEAITQLRRYSDQREETIAAGLKEGEPKLFHFNQLMIATYGDEAKYGTITSTEEYFYAWKDIYPEKYRQYSPPVGKERQQEVLIQGMLAPETLLDIVRNFALFMEVSKTRVKVICRYQQYRAVWKIIDRLRTEQNDERSGVVWHTQGSGKSLTMVFAIRKLRTCEDLKDFKIVLVNDRVDLEKQLGETAVLAGEKVTYIKNSSELKKKLSNTSSNLNMVMIHKFMEYKGIDVPYYLGLGIPIYNHFGVVNPSSRIILMIDEAHRTQSGDLGDNLFEAFPNAVRLAFTGTPLITDRHTKKTVDRFGSYIDKYKLQDAVNDGTTVQILYEGKTADTAIDNKAEFDRKFEDLFRDLPNEALLAIKKKYGAVGDILEAEQRIKAIAEDLVSHYIENILVNGFKAQVVCHSKMAAITYQKYINQALATYLTQEKAKANPDQELVEQISFLKSAVVVSSDGTNEKAVITQAIKSARELKAIDNFKRSFDYDKSETGIAFLIVCDMLLTGFDAPVEQVMYIDKKIKEHNLLQTIARVNRVYKGKTRGYVVDYIGLANHLKEALSIYAAEDQEDVQSSLKDISSEIPILESRYRRLLSLFRENGVIEIEAFVQQTITNIKTDVEILEHAIEILEDIRLRADFEVYLKKMLESMDVILPNSAADPFKIPVKRFGYILIKVKQRYKDNSLDITGAGEKVKKLINQHLISLGINPKIPPTELLSPNFIEELDKNNNSKSKASEMEHAIRKHCKIHLEEDPALFTKFSEKLEAIIQQFKDNWEQLCLELSILRGEIDKGRQDIVDGLSLKHAPFYDLIGQIAFGVEGIPTEHTESIKKLVIDIINYMRPTITIINFWNNMFEVNKLKGTLTDLMLFTNIEEIIKHSDKIVTEVAALAKVRHKDILS